MKANGVMPSLGSSTVRTAHRDVTERLRDAIVSGVLPAGTRLVQADLAANLAVSVTPVREALRELESQGLVDFDPFRGATVHQVSLAELDEVYEIRRALIPIAARERVRTITDEELAEAETVVNRMTLRVSDTRWVDDNRLLHRLLDGTSGQAHLRAIMRRLSDISSLYVGISVTTDPARRRRARDDHKALVKAYRKRDAEQVTRISLRHIADTAAVARTALVADQA
ncbi:GntR family transcriptional regulator [Pseudonocardia ailaonensis]|uniref:GntR family transcriptional regulator n=1 Tax=Pseudonocardia ailaonensis TaxID=367279 RepID=A0ABN2N3M6_9PSEU